MQESNRVSRLFLREWRKHRGLTQEKLAARAGVTQGMISQLETGESDFTGELLDKLARGLRCKSADLFHSPDEAPWSLWSDLNPDQQRQALRVLKALVKEEV